MAGSGFGWQIIQVATGIAPKKLNYPLAKSSTFFVFGYIASIAS